MSITDRPDPAVELAGVLSRAEARLLDELEDDGIRLGDGATAVTLLQELDHVRRPPIHEGRRPLYGAFVCPDGCELTLDDELIELIDLDIPVAQARRFADGRSTYLVRRRGRPPQLACFRRTVQYEADLVEIQQRTGVQIVQRTVMGTPRLFTDAGVVEWTGRSWAFRRHANHLLSTIQSMSGDTEHEIVRGILDLCVHWLSPARIGAILVYDFDPREDDGPSQDLDAAVETPHLAVTKRHHFPALFAALGQTDLAALVGPDGWIHHIGVGLRSSNESERAVPQSGGMRHRSAARYSWDHHHTLAFVVSEDGPVSVYREGRRLRLCDAAAADAGR